MTKIVVKYWTGTTRQQATASTYRGAMRIAARNRNAFGPTFWTEDGEQLIDAHGCLFTESELERQAREPQTPLHAFA